MHVCPEHLRQPEHRQVSSYKTMHNLSHIPSSTLFIWLQANMNASSPQIQPQSIQRGTGERAAHVQGSYLIQIVALFNKCNEVIVCVVFSVGCFRRPSFCTRLTDFMEICDKGVLQQRSGPWLSNLPLACSSNNTRKDAAVTCNRAAETLHHDFK